MTPLDLLAWSGAICGAVVAFAVAAAVVIGLVRSIAKPRPKQATRRIMDGWADR